MKIIVGIILIGITTLSYGQSRFGWQELIADKIKEKTRDVINDRVDSGALLADDIRVKCPEQGEEKLINQIKDATTNFGSFTGMINRSFSHAEKFPNAACQDWLKINTWSNANNNDEKIENTNDERLIKFLKEEGMTDAMIGDLDENAKQQMLSALDMSHSSSQGLQRMKISNASCVFASKNKNNCEAYIDLKSIRKGVSGIDYTFYTLWNYQNPVGVPPNEKTSFLTKVDIDKPVLVKSIRNLMGINCKQKKYMNVSWIANRESMGLGLRLTEGTYFTLGVSISFATNEGFDNSLNKKKLHIAENLNKEFINFTKDDRDSEKIIDVLCGSAGIGELKKTIEDNKL